MKIFRRVLTFVTIAAILAGLALLFLDIAIVENDRFFYFFIVLGLVNYAVNFVGRKSD